MLVVGDLVENAAIGIVFFRLKQLIDFFQQIVLLISETWKSFKLLISTETVIACIQTGRHLLKHLGFVLHELIFLDHVVKLEFAERLDESALIALEDKFADEICKPHRLDVSKDVDFFFHVLAGSLVAIILVLASLPPKTFLADEAAATQAQQPGQLILDKSVAELSSFLDGIFKVPLCFGGVVVLTLIFIFLRTGGVHVAGNRDLKLEIFVGTNHHAKEAPDERRDATDETKDQIKGVHRPSVLNVFSRLQDPEIKNGTLIARSDDTVGVF